MTDKIYQRDRYCREYTATVVKVEEDRLLLDATIFAPDAGGQPWDLGTIGGIALKKVTERDGEVVHVLRTKNHGLAEGDTVELQLDWTRRFDHMQNHLGEHILSGLFKREYDIDNKGFHMGEAEGTFDLDVPALSDEMLQRVEDLANEAVAQAIPVQVIFLQSREEAAQYPLRKPLTVEEDILVVSVSGVDCVACCCPHPSDTSQVGIIKITGTEKYKGMTRVHYLCGRRALLDYRQKHVVTETLNRKYSADAFSLLEKMQRADDKNETVRRELQQIRSFWADEESAALLATEGAYFLKVLQASDMEQLRQIAKRVIEQSPKPVLLAAKNIRSVLLAHSGDAKLDCGASVRELAVGGRGGGSPAQAQVVFESVEGMHTFLEEVAKRIVSLEDTEEEPA